jgi:hypothetical protein
VGVTAPLTALTGGQLGKSGEALLKPMELCGSVWSITVQFFELDPAERWMPALHVSLVPK